MVAGDMRANASRPASALRLPAQATAIGTTGQDQHLSASVNYEAGVRTRPGAFCAPRRALSHIRNQIIPNTAALGFLENAGETTHYGIEAAARLAFGTLFG
jgi:outer membrane receptor protein involved in Fe transport